MLTSEDLREFAKKLQTNERNVVREYVQHLFLSDLYRHRGSRDLLFKGGTALRLIYGSPRFSEDLDFTGRFYRPDRIEELLVRALGEVERTGVSIRLEEAKPTSGGYLAIINYRLFDYADAMHVEISMRKPKAGAAEVTTIVSEFMIPYTLYHLAPRDLVREKVQALVQRGKPRDYYDVYFLLRHPALNRFIDKGKLDRVQDLLDRERIDFRKELQLFLPVSHHAILKNFRGVLKKEISGY
ncbi:nucleotidyl transferase AbiEii/AbiGii toxin family protein [candidate division WOR-3 bacterium]|nr:nucleotidyl transferase AbiEii/AbiGii toxin family protein [candidate division WOR-3 bacterium]